MRPGSKILSSGFCCGEVSRRSLVRRIVRKVLRTGFSETSPESHQESMSPGKSYLSFTNPAAAKSRLRCTAQVTHSPRPDRRCLWQVADPDFRRIEVAIGELGSR